MKYNIQKTIVKYFKHSDGTEVFFKGKFSPEPEEHILNEIQPLIDQGKLEIIEREEDAFIEEAVGYVVPLKDYRVIRRYPEIGNQLDMLWHELNTTGTISSDGAWFNAIKDIKDNIPKP